MGAYGTTLQLTSFGVPAAALTEVPLPVQAEYLEAVSREVDRTAFRPQGVDVPLASWPADLTQDVCKVVGADLLRWRGIEPEKTENEIFAEAKRIREEWRKMGEGKAPLYTGIVDAEPATTSGGAVSGVAYDSRGWSTPTNARTLP